MPEGCNRSDLMLPPFRSAMSVCIAILITSAIKLPGLKIIHALEIDNDREKLPRYIFVNKSSAVLRSSLGNFCSINLGGGGR